MSRSPGADVGGLWLRMIALYGHRWTSQFGEIPTDGSDTPAMAAWAQALKGVPERHLALGIKRCVERGDPWPPSLPGFVALCHPTPEDFGLKPTAQAYREGIRAGDRPGHVWSHPAVARAWRAAVAAAASNAFAREAVFARIYRHLVRRVLAGDRIDHRLPEPLLNPAEEAPATRAEARRHLDDLARITGARPALPAPACKEKTCESPRHPDARTRTTRPGPPSRAERRRR